MDGIDPGMMALLKDSNGDDKTLWLFLLLLLYGKDGGLGGSAGSCCPPVTLEQMNDAQNAVQSSQRDFANGIVERTMDITRDQTAAAAAAADGFARVCSAIHDNNSANLVGQKDLQSAIAQCCCDNLNEQKTTQRLVDSGLCETRNAINVQGLQTQNAIDKCCCETQTAIALQTNTLQASICADGDKTRQLITQNKIDELQAALTDAKLANSNLTQTGVLQSSIREACCQPCQPCHPHPWFGGQPGGFVPPGQQP